MTWPLVLLVWIVLGAVAVGKIRPDLRKETWLALLNCIIWPIGLVVPFVDSFFYRRRKRLRDRRRVAT